MNWLGTSESTCECSRRALGCAPAGTGSVTTRALTSLHELVTAVAVQTTSRAPRAGLPARAMFDASPSAPRPPRQPFYFKASPSKTHSFTGRSPKSRRFYWAKPYVPTSLRVLLLLLPVSSCACYAVDSTSCP